MKVRDVMKRFLTQTALADALGCAQPSVARWVKNDKIPLLRQYQIEDLTNGALAATRKRGRKNVQPQNTD